MRLYYTSWESYPPSFGPYTYDILSIVEVTNSAQNSEKVPETPRERKEISEVAASDEGCQSEEEIAME